MHYINLCMGSGEEAAHGCYTPFSHYIDQAGWAHSQRRVGVNITIPLH